VVQWDVERTGEQRNMKLYYDKKSKDPTYFIQKGVRIGKKTTTKNVLRIGKHSELLKITDDPLTYASLKVQEANELEKKNKTVSVQILIDYSEKLISSGNDFSKSTTLNVGYFFVQSVYRSLKLKEFFKNILAGSKIEFDPDCINRFLISSRVLFPCSKLEFSKSLHRFYEQPDFSYQHVLRTMDLISTHFDEYIKHLYANSTNLSGKRNLSVCYYDCTNFYFEVDCPDYDYVDEVTGEFFKGFRKYGISKQHQPKPLVGMGLMMDRDGIPLTMCLYPGNKSEQETAIPLETELIRLLDGKKIIYCADAGLGSYHIRSFNSISDRAFVVTQSIKKLSKQLQDAIFQDFEYKSLSSDKPVSLQSLMTMDKHELHNLGLYNEKAYRVLPGSVELETGLHTMKVDQHGHKRRVKEKVPLVQSIIVTFSRKTMEYQRFVRNAQIERAKSILEMSESSYRKGPNDVTRFLKRKGNARPTGKEKVSDLYELDIERIREEEKYDGFYAIATNLSDTPQEILKIVADRYKIEECFRILKTDFTGRPVYHRTEARIKAHFMICYTALLVYRLLEKKLNSVRHYPIESVIKTLQNMQVVPIDVIGYAASYDGSEICSVLNKLFQMGLDKKYYLPKDLNRMAKQ